MMVAIGASAGRVEALQELFRAMPIDTGLVFAVILHTPPIPTAVWRRLFREKHASR